MCVASATAGASDSAPPGRWDLCPPVLDARARELPPPSTLDPETTQVTADTAYAEAESITRLRGNVVVQRGSATLLGDTANYNRRSDLLHMLGNVSYRDKGTRIDSEEAQMLLGQESGTFNAARFHFPDGHASGHAGKIIITDKEHARLEQLRYTTCHPDKVDWELKADALELNRETNTGEAWNATLSLKGVPFLYTPYINFPLEGRKSGLLPPTFGNSERNGTDFSLPIYWNIAPNQDATITPRTITRRGAMLMGEYRFLTRNTNGQINGSFLGDDTLYGDDRSYFSLRHNARFGTGWRSNLVYRRASDSDFFLDELAGPEESGSQTHLERRADLHYSDHYWRFLARVQNYQTLSGSAPYQRLPQLRLNGATPERKNRLRLELASEAVRFDHENPVPTGDRLDVKPALSLPLGGPAWFLTPKLAWRYTSYRLQDYAPGETYERSLPIGSIDGGLFFERSLRLDNTPYTQTLEPRLFYLRVPYEDQDELPRFDTGQSDLSFAQLFSDNRFTGADRQGDADQLTVALTSRLLDERSGRERLRAAIGQVHYYRDREVTLTPGASIATRNSSDIFGEITVTPTDALSFRVTEQWNPDEQQVERLNSRLRYAPGARKVFNLGYRYTREDELHQADMVVLWPINRRWRLLGRHYYDLENEATLDTIGGLEYESCCWSLQVLARAQRNSINEELNHSIYFTLELKGLANLGRSLEESVGRGILD